MKPSIKLLIIISLIAVPIMGVVIAENIAETFLYPQQAVYSPGSANSTVFILNGVSGTVTITDPTLGKNVSVNIDYDPLESGSGAIITPNGYIITAFHVISDVRTLKSQKLLKTMSDEDIKLYLEEAAVNSYLSRNPRFGSQLLYNNPAQSFQINDHNVDLVVAQLSQSNLISVSSSKQVVKVRLPSSNGVNKFIDANIVDVGNATMDEDVALLKIDASDLPALQINSGKPRTGENLRIYGYPGNNSKTEMQYLMNSTVIPATSAGSLKSQIANPQGIRYYETSAQVSEGYSGGPVLDAQNKILGIVIYSIEKQSGFKQFMSSQSSVFLSSEYLIELCKRNNVPITLSG